MDYSIELSDKVVGIRTGDCWVCFGKDRDCFELPFELDLPIGSMNTHMVLCYDCVEGLYEAIYSMEVAGDCDHLMIDTDEPHVLECALCGMTVIESVT